MQDLLLAAAQEVGVGIGLVALDEDVVAFRNQLETAVPMPNFAEMTLMWSPVTTAMNKIVKGSASPEAALQEAQKQVAASIAALRKGN